MISGIVPFEEIVQSIKDETGIENIRPLYEKIRRLIFRAEREIGYGGTVELIKKTYLIAGLTGDCNFGKYIKFPEDFIELEGIGQKCCPVPEYKYRATSDGIRFKEKQDTDIVLLYWGIKVDDAGYPLVTRNHEEAVIAFIVWKLYSSRMFLGLGAFNLHKDYEHTFTMALLEARGDDAFPTLEQMNELALLSETDRRILLDIPVRHYDYCAEYEDIVCEGEEVGDERTVAYWQLNSLTEDIDDVIPLIDDVYLDALPNVPLSIFEAGNEVDYVTTGRICFCIRETEDVSYVLKNNFGNNVTGSFDVNYDAGTRTKLYVSINVYTSSTIYTQILIP